MIIATLLHAGHGVDVPHVHTEMVPVLAALLFLTGVLALAWARVS